MTDAPELNLCYRCASRVYLCGNNSVGFFIQCSDPTCAMCFGGMPADWQTEGEYETPEKAITAWNTRSDLSADRLAAAEKLAEALRSAAEDLDDYSPLTGNTIDTPASRAARAALAAWEASK